MGCSSRNGQRRLLVAPLFSLALACVWGSDSGSEQGGSGESVETTEPTGAAMFHCPGVVEFADADLEAAVRDAADQPEGDLTAADVESVYQLSAPAAGIGQLDGIECMQGLTILLLWDNEIVDLTRLSELAMLEGLDVGSNQVVDLSPLAAVTTLRVLKLGRNQITDLGPLAGVAGLGTLLANENQISDISVLSGLSQLRYVDLSSNPLEDIGPLADLPELDSLFLIEDQVSDLTPLANATKLATLSLTRNQVEDLSPLASVTSLSYLDLDDNLVMDLGPLVDNPGLDAGDTIKLMGNPFELDCAAQSANLDALRARGVVLLTSCP